MSDKKWCVRFKRTSGGGRRCAKFDSKRRGRACSKFKVTKDGKRKCIVFESNNKDTKTTER